jgi:hypothetical protein
MDKNDTSPTGNYLVPTSGQAIARRSDSLVKRGLRELDAAKQGSQCQDVFQRLDELYLSYGRGIGLDDGVGVCKADESFSRFSGDSSTECYVFEFFLFGNDDLDFWKGIGDPAGLTQEKRRAALLEWRSRLQEVGAWAGSVREIRPPSESHIMVSFDLFRSEKFSSGLAIWSEPEGAHVEIDGSFVGNTPLEMEITTGEHLVVVRKTAYETWSQKLQVSRWNL